MDNIVEKMTPILQKLAPISYEEARRTAIRVLSVKLLLDEQIPKRYPEYKSELQN